MDEKIKYISLPNLRPGEDVDVSIFFGSTAPVNDATRMKIYSNLGSAKIIVYGVDPDGGRALYLSFWEYIWENIYQIFSWIAVLSWLVFWLQINMMKKYHQVLLNDEDFYLSERVRYEKLGKKFEPSWIDSERLARDLTATETP